jgi:outer membrane protein assembly factor BamB
MKFLAITCLLASISHLTLVQCAEPATQSSNWPQFRGPNATGLGDGAKYPTHFGPGQNMKWVIELPGGASSPCIWGNRIFLTGFNKSNKSLETFCINRETGNIIWRQSAPAEKIEKVHATSSPANATPATDGERVYVYFASYGLVAYTFEGQVAWKKPIPLVQSNFGSGTSPVLVGGKLILIHDEMPSSYLLAVDSKNGDTIWQTPRGPSFTKYSTPTSTSSADGAQVFVVGGQRFVAYDIRDGKAVWWIDGIPPQVIGVPVVGPNAVFFSATGMFGEPENFVALPSFEEFAKKFDADKDGFVALTEIPKDFPIVDRRTSDGSGNTSLVRFLGGADRDGDKKLSAQEWDDFSKNSAKSVAAEKPAVYAVGLSGHGDVSRTQVKWKESREVPEVPSLLYHNERVYGVRNGGIIHCRNASSGKIVFSERLGALGGYYASPVAADSKIYCASDQGLIVVIAAGDEFKVLARNDLKERIVATPALVDGVIYTRTNGHLYAFAE